MFLSQWLLIRQVVAAAVAGESIVSYPTPDQFFLAFDQTNKLFMYGSAVDSNSYANVSIYYENYEHVIGNVYSVYVSEPGDYRTLVDICDTKYLTDPVTAQSISPLLTFPEAAYSNIIAFHHGNFVATDYNSAHATVEEAAAAGYFYANTPSGNYRSGTLGTPVLNGTASTTYTWTPGMKTSGDVLMVAGGGGGGQAAQGVGGGGGAGGLLIHNNVSLSGEKTIVVGNGGLVNTNGTNTSFEGLTTAIGGGGGRDPGNGLAGGSGGGGGSHTTSALGGAGTAGQGNPGGDGFRIIGPYKGGGGGGAGAPGQDNTTQPDNEIGLNGGIGADVSNIFGFSYGVAGFFAGGGGGGVTWDNFAVVMTPGSGGLGGGGLGAVNQGAAGNSIAHTGGGGGGGGWDGAGSAGGSGIVLVRYDITNQAASVEPKNIWVDAQGTEVKLTSNDAAVDDNFGIAVGLSGNTAIIGANLEDEGAVLAGAAYIFEKSGSTWNQQAKLIAADAAAQDNFGTSVAISANTAVIGAPNDAHATLTGSAYVFERSGSSWTEQTKLLSTGGTSGDEFGTSIGIDGNTVVVGAPKKDSDAGAAYVFVGSGASWPQESQLVPTGGLTAGDNFGNSTRISGDSIIVGSPFDGDGGANAGAAYIFTRTASVWSQETKLVAGDANAEDVFGYSVDISGDLAVVGAYGDNSAYIFRRNGTTWTQEAKLTAADAVAGDNFGRSVSISGSIVIVGAYLDDSQGSAYIFSNADGSWIQKEKLTASDAADDNEFGGSVFIDGSNAIIAAVAAEAAYIYNSETGEYTGVPQLSFDGFDKLILQNTSNTNVDTNLRVGSAIYDLDDLSNVYISDTGNYKSFTVDPDGHVAYFGNVTVDTVTASAEGPPGPEGGTILAFHHGNFVATDYNSAHATVEEAAAAGFFYANTPPGDYFSGTLGTPAFVNNERTTYTWTPLNTNYVGNALLIAGGGGGGGVTGGGGGAGGHVYSTNYKLDGTKTIEVGAGGLGGVGFDNAGQGGINGRNSSMTGLTVAIGGGGGAGHNDDANAGGSGGGASHQNVNQRAAGTAGQGFAGGTADNFNSGGGGGGAGGVGGDAVVNDRGGNGGPGISYETEFSNVYGDSGWFASGGGGGGRNDSGFERDPGTASIGGGSDGVVTTAGAVAAQSHTGGGGGGAGYDGPSTLRVGATGGSGVVLFKITNLSKGSITFDSFNKLITGGSANKKLYKGSETYDIGSSSEVFISESGEYKYFSQVPEYNYSFLGSITVPTITTNGSPPTLSYDNLNALTVEGAEANSYITYTTGKMVGCGTNLTYQPIYTPGSFRATVLSSALFTITNTVQIPTSEFLPHYKFPPSRGTVSDLTVNAGADVDSTWKMSSTYGSGVYTATSSIAADDTTVTAYHAFDSSNTTSFESTSTTGILTLKLPTAVYIRKYRVQPKALDTNRPNSWTIQGSTDGSSWTTLHTVTATPPTGTTLSFTEIGNYQWYRMNVSANAGGSSLEIAEIELWGDIPFTETPVFSDSWTSGVTTVTRNSGFTVPTIDNINGLTIQGSVDTSTPGFYYIGWYRAVNSTDIQRIVRKFQVT